MTKDEARARQKWAGMDGTIAFHLIDRSADGWEETGLMMDAWLEENQKQNTIAQNIRNAAINWPKFLGDVECGILHAFFGDWAGSCSESSSIRACLSGTYGTEEKMKARTFMLLVAEALES
jgi:hypothetical protein